MENMIRSITIKSGYNPTAYENPCELHGNTWMYNVDELNKNVIVFPAALQLHYAILQSLALDQADEPPKVEDKTMPRNKQIKDVSAA